MRFFLIAFLLVTFTRGHTQPAELWASVIGGQGNEAAEAICSDNSGNVYLGASYHSTLSVCNNPLPAVIQPTVLGNNTLNFSITKLNKNGSCVWNVTGISKVALNAQGVLAPQILDMKYYKGAVYCSGVFCDTMVFNSLVLSHFPTQFITPFVLKVDTSGTVLWGRCFHTTNGLAYAKALCVSDGGVYVTGSYSDSISFGSTKLIAPMLNSYLLHLDHNGNYKWAKNLGTGWNWAEDMAYDNANGLYITGTYGGTFTAGSSSIIDTTVIYASYVGKFDTTGANAWVHGGFPKVRGSLTRHRLAYSGTGAIYLHALFTDSARWGSTGFAASPGKYKDIVVKINSAGHYQWSRAFGNKTVTTLFGGIPEVNKRGVMLYTGYTDTAIVGTQTLISQGNLDNLLIQYDHSGNMLWQNFFGGTAQEMPIDLHSNNGAIYFASRSMSNYAIGSLNVSNAGGGDILIVKLFDPLASGIAEEIHPNRLVIFPNPGNNEFDILSERKIQQVAIHDLLGNEIKRFPGQQHFIVEGLAQGVYLFTVTVDGRNTVQRVVITH